MHSRQNESYSFDLKLSIVKLYLSNELSYQVLALQEVFLHPAQIQKWINDFRIAVFDALSPLRKVVRKHWTNLRKILWLNPSMTLYCH